MRRKRDSQTGALLKLVHVAADDPAPAGALERRVGGQLHDVRRSAPPSRRAKLRPNIPVVYTASASRARRCDERRGAQVPDAGAVANAARR